MEMRSRYISRTSRCAQDLSRLYRLASADK